MAGPKSFAGFDRAQQNNYYWYWQRVNPKFQFYQRDPFGSGYEQQHSCCLLPGYGCGPAVDGNEHTLSAHGISGLPAGTPVAPEITGSDVFKMILRSLGVRQHNLPKLPPTEENHLQMCPLRTTSSIHSPGNHSSGGKPR
ncbi:putative uncharacterized protein C6orf52 homolog isoform X2 [Myotis myotis]|uniref:putative uncharacterized protein C6orf52 homolog isoform X2 n=1 Tax=Myotis myotis TaxID=51298 RepID=UPI00174DA5A4|nr:putative uncharacterized protein C6orf52 homolog isoform X2 [Myotis myotis]